MSLGTDIDNCLALSLLSEFLRKMSESSNNTGLSGIKSQKPQTTRYSDLAVKRKAVSQPTYSFASWLEGRKENTTGASTGRIIQDIETALPPRKGEGALFLRVRFRASNF
jgi:hypothetical protein